MQHVRIGRAARTVAVLVAWSIGFCVGLSPISANGAELEVRASLSGYNLLWPTKRCCSFDLVLQPTGKGVVTIHRNDGGSPADETWSFQLSETEMESLRQVIADNDFFGLPSPVGDMPIHADERSMKIRLDQESKEVVLFDWGRLPASTNVSDEMRRAGAVWTAIRGLVKAPSVKLP